MHRRQAGSNSLTAHLARAAGDQPDRPVTAGPDERDKSTLEAKVATGRCIVSVMPGQHCNRRALDGQTICAGHAAMGGSALATARR